MKQITLNIQDSKFNFFLELIKNFDFIHVSDDIVIPEEHKKIVRERIEKYGNSLENYQEWKDIEDKIKLD